MRIEKNGHPITSVAEWKQYAPPKRDDQWVEGRSAFELAFAWCSAGQPSMPGPLRTLLESREETRALVVDSVSPEHRIRFDAHGGEPRNADLAFVGRTNRSTVAVTIEAKADEPFGATVAETIAEALERGIQNAESQGVKRVEDLVRALLPPRRKGQPHVGGLRYQLLTAAAGTLAYAVEQGATTAVLVVHEFITDKTSDNRHTENAEDFRAFLYRLGGEPLLRQESSMLVGPFGVPGLPVFPASPKLLIGKIVTNRRRLDA